MIFAQEKHFSRTNHRTSQFADDSQQLLSSTAGVFTMETINVKVYRQLGVNDKVIVY